MRILFLGDVFGKPGRKAVNAVLPDLKKEVSPDVVIANVENIMHGRGINLKSLEEMRSAGVDFFTSGNHAFDGNEVLSFIDDKKMNLIRPANYPVGTPGHGFDLFSTQNGKKILIINLLGRVFIRENLDCPFRSVDDILERFKDVKLDAIFVDFHAEATAEKVAMGMYLDGRVSAVVGTHTHVATADARVLPKGTAYQSDVGFVGPLNSVIGIKPQDSINFFLTQINFKMEIANGPKIFNAVLITTDDKAHSSSIEIISKTID